MAFIPIDQPRVFTPLFDKKSQLSKDKIAKLNAIGFAWLLEKNQIDVETVY